LPASRKSQPAHELTGTKPRWTEPTPSAFEAGRAKCPAHLCPEARAEFRRVSKILGTRGTETPGDFAVLAVYAECYSRWVLAKKELAEGGLLVEETVLSSNGAPIARRKLNPLYRVLADCEARLVRLAETMGLTPVVRDRVKPAATPEEKQEPSAVEKCFPEIFGRKETA